MKSFWAGVWVLAVLCSVSSWAEEEGKTQLEAEAGTEAPPEAVKAPKAEKGTSSTPSTPYSEHKYHFGAFLSAGLPTQLSDDGYEGNFGLGWGFVVGFHNPKHWAFELRSTNEGRTIEPGFRDDEDMASERATTANAKFFPSKEGPLAFYGLASLGIQSLAVTEDGGSWWGSAEDNEPVYFGYNWGLGVGIEQEMRAPLTFFAEFGVEQQIYNSVALGDKNSNLDPNPTRWAFTLRAGVMAGFF